LIEEEESPNVFFLRLSNGDVYKIPAYSSFEYHVESITGVPQQFQEYLTGTPLKILKGTIPPVKGSVVYFREKLPSEAIVESFEDWAPLAQRVATQDGNLKMLEWIRERGVPPNASMCKIARDYERDDVLRWMTENGVICQEA
jgi:hypothetical protein